MFLSPFSCSLWRALCLSLSRFLFFLFVWLSLSGSRFLIYLFIVCVFDLCFLLSRFVCLFLIFFSYYQCLYFCLFSLYIYLLFSCLSLLLSFWLFFLLSSFVSKYMLIFFSILLRLYLNDINYFFTDNTLNLSKTSIYIINIYYEKNLKRPQKIYIKKKSRDHKK